MAWAQRTFISFPLLLLVFMLLGRTLGAQSAGSDPTLAASPGRGGLGEAVDFISLRQFFRAIEVDQEKEKALLNEEGIEFASHWLAFRNGAAGIEQVGGPFTLANFKTVRASILNPPWINLTFFSTKSLSPPGLPSSFQVLGGRVEHPTTHGPKVHFGLFDSAGLDALELAAVQRQIAAYSYSSETNDLVEIGPSGEVTRRSMLFLPIQSIRKEGGQLTVYTGGFSRSEIRRRQIPLEKKGGRWAVPAREVADLGTEPWTGRAAEVPLTLIIKGELETAEIESIVSGLEQFGRLPTLVRLQVLGDASLKADPDVQHAEPAAKYIFHRVHESWLLRYRLQVSHFALGMFGPPILPFLPPPDPAALKEAAAHPGWARSKLSGAEIRFLAETVLRVRGIDHQILGVESRNGNVHVRTGIVFGPLAGEGHIIIFERQQGRWILQQVGEWIS